MAEDPVLVPVLFKLPEGRVALDHEAKIYPSGRASNAPGSVDFWLLRDKLLSSKTGGDLVDFLNKCGYACVASDRNIKPSWELKELSPTLSNSLFELKRLLIAWMPLASNRWGKLKGRFDQKLLEYVCLGTGRHHALSATFGWSAEGEPSVAVFPSDPLEAIVITVHIDRLRKVRFKSCARRDCRKPFTLTSGHRRKYCEWYCGHLVSVRKSYQKKRQKQHQLEAQ